MKKIISAIIATALIFSSLSLFAFADVEATDSETVSTTVSGYVSSTEGDIEIASNSKTPSIYVDAEDWAGVTRVVSDLQSDIKAVTDVTANITNDAANADIIVGTIGKSDAIDALIESGTLDVSEIEGEWEAFTIQNIGGKLIIAGADKRGTIYGVYDLSEKMGVSPWEWWADVTPSHSDAIYVTLPDGGYTEGAPSVKYRGIFINQEYNLNRWSALLGDNDTDYMNTAAYEKIFELLLRLKANYMWPAMHEYSPAFNVNPENAKKADEYGIVMASSHCEMLLRNNMGELLEFQTKWIEEHPDKNLYMFNDGSLGTMVAYDYTDVDAEGNPVDNKEFVEDYWRERVRENGKYENNYTIGMRGVHDGAWNPVSAKTDAEKIALLEEIITKQREILSEEIGKPANEIPQTFIPYKEIADLYNIGIDIPDDVTIMFTNDNYGYVRQGMNEDERARSGGGGMYYHVSYHGRPSDLLWNGSTQLGLIKEEMTKAYDSGADTVWVLNVGPLKPFENQMEYFLDLGRNIDTMRETSVRDYVADNARRYFGFNEEQSAEYADIQCERLEAVNARRPEFFEQGLFSLTSYGDEGQKLVDKYTDLLKRSEALYNSLPEDKKPAFYELQLYAVKSAYNIVNNYIGADKSVLYKSQGRGAGVNKYAAQSNSGNQDAVKADVNEYNTMLGGKWNKMIDPFVTKGSLNASWNFSIASAVSETVSELGYTDMGIMVENQQDVNERPALEFSGYTKDVRFIDIYNSGSGSFDWKATANADWIIFNKKSGTVYDDDRIYVGIDWDNAPDGTADAKITITRYIGDNAVKSEEIEVKLNNDIKDLPEKTYAEANGYVSIEAEHYSTSVSSGSTEVITSDGVVTGNTPKLVTEVSDGEGIIAVYKQDGTLSSVQSSVIYTDGAYIFEKPINLGAGETVKGMVWSSLSEMLPLTETYGIAKEEYVYGEDEYRWQEQDDFGRSGSSMKFMPDTAVSISDNSAYLEYDVNFESTGTFDVDVYRMPTLNERGSVKFAVGIDDAVPSELSGTNKYYVGSSTPHSGAWAQGILNNNETLTTAVTVNEAGIHKIKLYGIDPGAVVDKIVITTGTKYSSYYGAPESYNTTYNNKAAVMPEPSTASTEIAGDITALFTPKLYTSDINFEGRTVTGVDVIKLDEVSNAQITVAAYDNDGIMLASATETADFSQAQINEKVTVSVDNFTIPNGTAEIQAIVYDSKETLNALSPSYTIDTNSISLMASYNSGVIELKSNLDQHTGKEAICLISDASTSDVVYIRQETVKENTFKKINTGELDGTYDINIGVSNDGVVISEKAYTAQNITPDNEEVSTELYNWDFADETQVGTGNNIPVVGGNAVYDSENQAVKMTSTDKSGGNLSVAFDEAIKTTQGQKITVVSKIAYGRQSGKYMDYVIADSNGNELVKTHISMYSSSSSQSLQIGGVEQIESGIPAGIAETKNKNNSGIVNGYSTFTTTLDPDTNTITLVVSNAEGESTFTGKFPEGSSYDLGALNFSTTQTYTSRSCYVDDISVTKTSEPSYTMSFDVQDMLGNKIDNAQIIVTDGKYGTVISSENDGTYYLCDGIYTYTVMAAGYETVTNELELSPATESKTILVKMEATGITDPVTPSPSPTATPTATPTSTPTASPTATPSITEPTPTPIPSEPTEYDSTAGHWLFDFGADTADGYIGVSSDTSFTDELTYGFIGINEDDYKLTSGEYMDGFRIVQGQKITLADGDGTASAPNDDFVAVTDAQYPIRFTMSVENGGYYNVKVTLVNASQTEPAVVSLFTERRHQLLTNAEMPAGGTLEYEFNVDVETYYSKALNGQYKDDTLSIEVAGTNAAISSMEVTKAEEKGKTIWILSDSTGCDQPTNFPYFNLGSLAGVGQGLTKYLPADIAMSNQGDGGIASNDTNHFNAAKAGFKEGDYLYVEYGHNETSVDSYKTNLQKYYDACVAAKMKMIVVGPIDRCNTKNSKNEPLFDSSTGKWTSTLSGYSAAGKEFVDEKIAAGASDIAFVDLNASWIEFLNGTTESVKTMRSSETYEADSVYYYYRYKSSGIDTTHINDAGADNAAYIFFTEAKKIVEANADAQAAVLADLVNGMRNQTPYTVTDEIVSAGKVPNSYYPEIPTEAYEGYEAEIKNVSFDGELLKSVTAKIEHYTGLDKKDIPYAVAIAEIYGTDGNLVDTYQSTTGTKYDTTNGNGTFTLVFDDANAVLPENGTYKIWLQGFTSDNQLMEGEDYRISDYYTPDSVSDLYLIGDKEDIEIPDTFSYYGIKQGSDLAGNNGWYLVGSSSKSATLEKETIDNQTVGYAQLIKTSEKTGSYIVYRAFDSAVSSSKIVLDTDLYYEEGYMKFTLSNKTNTPNSGYSQRIDCFTINNGKLLDSNGAEIGEFPANEWTHITYVLDMDYGTQTMTVGNSTPYEYTAVGMDSINPSDVTVSALQQLNIAGSSSATMSARITNTSVKNTVQEELPEYTLTLMETDGAEGTVSIADSDGLTKTAKMNSIVTVSAVPAEDYTFAGWYENETLVSGTANAQIRLHRDVTLTAKFEQDIDPIEYAYKETFTTLTTDTLAANGWVSKNAQSSVVVKTDDTWADGNYVYFDGSTNTRNVKITFPETAKLTEKYVIEMDFALVNGTGSASEFTIFTSDTTVPDNASVSGDYLLKLTSTASSKTMPWTINDDANNTVTLEQVTRTPVWAHLKMTVDPATGNAELIVTQSGEEKYNGTIQTAVTNGNYAAAGMNFKAVKSYSRCQFDNIKIYTASQITQ